MTHKRKKRTITTYLRSLVNVNLITASMRINGSSDSLILDVDYKGGKEGQKAQHKVNTWR